MQGGPSKLVSLSPLLVGRIARDVISRKYCALGRLVGGPSSAFESGNVDCLELFYQHVPIMDTQKTTTPSFWTQRAPWPKRSRRKQKRREARRACLPFRVDSQPRPRLRRKSTASLSLTRPIKGVLPSFPLPFLNTTTMKLKFDLFITLGVVASVAAPGAYAWGAAG